jgi:ferritin-like metal-binding protein YciE
MSVKTVQDLFVNELRDIYHAEKQLLRALPKMAKSSTHPELKQAFESHLEETRGQVERLEQVFDQLDLSKRAKPCQAMEGLIEEAKEHMGEIEDKSVLDVGIIISAQKVEHYEIAAYGTVAAYAGILGFTDDQNTLHAILDEEKNTDRTLTDLAEKLVNKDAVRAA